MGFFDESLLVRAVARCFRVKPLFVQVSRYRAGEIAMVGPRRVGHRVIVVTNITSDPMTLFRSGLLVEALRDHGARRVELLAPWIAYGRQDKAARAGEAPAGRVVGRLLSTIFDRIVTLDAHSHAFIKAFRGKLLNILPLEEIIRSRSVERSSTQKDMLIAAPDSGARDRAKRAADALGVPFIVVEKKRVRGKIVASRLDAREKDIQGAHALLIDDIADSGETLVRAACVLKAAGVASVSARVTHAVNLTQLRRAHHGVLHRIDAVFDHSTGRISGVAIKALAAQARQT